jgi:hypothetical protein
VPAAIALGQVDDHDPFSPSDALARCGIAHDWRHCAVAVHVHQLVISSENVPGVLVRFRGSRRCRRLRLARRLGAKCSGERAPRRRRAQHHQAVTKKLTTIPTPDL